KTLEDLKGWDGSDAVHPEDLARTVKAQRDAHIVGQSYDVESRHRRHDGAYRWFNVLGLPIRNDRGEIVRWFHLQIDIDDRKRAEEALSARERDARTMFDEMPIGAAIVAPSGRRRSVNKAMTDYFGRSVDEIGVWTTTIHPDDEAHF